MVISHFYRSYRIMKSSSACSNHTLLIFGIFQQHVFCYVFTILPFNSFHWAKYIVTFYFRIIISNILWMKYKSVMPDIQFFLLINFCIWRHFCLLFNNNQLFYWAQGCDMKSAVCTEIIKFCMLSYNYTRTK